MIICDSCKETFQNNSIFIKHVKLTHSDLKIFRCAESECRKTYSVLISFCKHRQAKHNNSNVKKVYENDSRMTSNVDSDTAVWKNNSKSKSELINFHFPEDDYESSDSETLSEIPEGELLFENKSDCDLTFEGSSDSTNKMDDSILQFAAKLYKFPNMPRKLINLIMNDASDLFDSLLNCLKSETSNRLQSLGASKDYLSEIENVFNKFSVPFHNVKTERKRLSQFESYDTLIMPQNYKIGERTDFKTNLGGTTRINIPLTAQLIPIRYVLKKFFEMPSVFQETEKYINFLFLGNEIISNIIQSPHWKKKLARHDPSKKVYPLLLYFDDYENNNPLGSHKGISKCGAVYLSIPCLPPEFQAKIENIFLFILFNSLDRTSFTNSIVFQKTFEELKFLQNTGITLNLPTGKQTLYFDLALIIGDNLGLHSIFGFTESFRANKFCRFCLTQSKKINSILKESDCILRNIENYDSLLALNDVTKSGIKSNCVFNEIPGFHVTENPAVDVMHDFLEGVCRYDVALLLHYFIYVRKYFTLDDLNVKLRAFYYGPNKSINKPPEILVIFDIRKK